jgi:dTDP-4-dehydrorhamnose reductase
MPIAITGAAGQLGRELCRQLGDKAIGLERNTLDLANPDAVRRVIDELRPSAVINCAAYTKVDLAEKEPDLCRKVNALAVEYLAEACRANDCPLVQISTDYVFGADASRATPYQETDTPGPQSVYARTKLEGEQHAATWEKHLIVRTCGLYAPASRTGNFVETMLRLAREGKLLRVVDDQFCTPSYVPDVARAVLFLLSKAAFGTYHVVNTGETTWRRFAEEIFRQSHLNVSVHPITTEEYHAPAPRPRYSVLDTGKYHQLGGPPMPPWRDALSQYLKETRNPAPLRPSVAGDRSPE